MTDALFFSRNQYLEDDDPVCHEHMPPLLSMNPVVYDKKNVNQYFDNEHDELFQQILLITPTVKNIFIKSCFW